MQAMTGLPRFSMESMIAAPMRVFLGRNRRVLREFANVGARGASRGMTTRTSASSLMEANACFSSCMVAMLSALSTFGRSIVM